MKEDIEKLADSGTDITKTLASAENIGRSSVQTILNTDGSVNMNFTGIDPMFTDIQNVMDLSAYQNDNVTLAVEYETDVLGLMQIYYTSDLDENYSEDKVVSVTLTEKEGTAYFEIPVTEYTRMRFDTPEGSKVKIKSFKVGVYNCKIIDYGYDGPYIDSDEGSYSYLPYIHNYELNKLPVIWAESDKKKSVDNPVLEKFSKENGVYKFNLESSEYGTNGNYLKISLNYYGLDQSGNTDDDDETTSAIIKLGTVKNGKFEPKYLYTFTVEEGAHDYMFRVSNDYYWYTGNINAVIIESDSQLNNITMEILKGD